ncbi:MAG: hypothetical protein EZS28_035898, partial [Streblomastix strix]
MYQREQKFAFKIAFDFGVIIERVDGQENDQQISYKINHPLEARTEIRVPTTIRTHLDLAEYKRFIRNHIIQMQEKTIMDTKEKIIGIFSIMIQVFILSHAGAGGGGRTISSQRKHIMRREIRYIDPEKNNQNLCFFLAYSFITMPDIKTEDSVAAKRYKEHSRIAVAKQLFQRINGKKIDYNYEGFNFATEADQFMQNENLNTNVFAYETVTETTTETTAEQSANSSANQGSYYLWKQYRGNEQNEQTKDFNVLLITDTINELETAHVFYINDVEALTGLKYCPICGEARKVIDSNKYEDETIPQHYE